MMKDREQPLATTKDGLTIIRRTSTLLILIVAFITIVEIAIGTSQARRYLPNFNGKSFREEYIWGGSAAVQMNNDSQSFIAAGEINTLALANNSSSATEGESKKQSVPTIRRRTNDTISVSVNTTATTPVVLTTNGTGGSEPVSVSTSPVLSNSTEPTEQPLDPEEAKRRHFQNVIKPFTNVTTVGYYYRSFYAGFRNQIMAFTFFVMEAVKANRSQILLQTLSHKDTYGSNRYMAHEYLFDVEHWNSYYPRLPRMVSCDPVLFDEFDCGQNKWKPNITWTRPYAHGRHHHLFGGYVRYSKRRGDFAKPDFPHKVDLLIMQGALRPHPDLRAIVDKHFQSLQNAPSSSDGTNPNGDTNTNTSTSTATSASSEYIALHARVEPDMQRHPVCREKKVMNLTQIFQFVEAAFPDPPATKVFIPINRQYMEKEGYPNKKDPNATNWLAVENLKALNYAVQHGLWGGRVRVFEFGAAALKGTNYQYRPSTTGALLNFYLALNAKIFIGTEISSYSSDLVNTRFYTDNRQNYKYLPSGIERWTTDEMREPPGFSC